MATTESHDSGVVAPRPCKLCGAMIEIQPGPDGRQIPLQRVGRIYMPSPTGAGVDTAESMSGAFYVSHFETCPEANRESGAG